jgi:hypothetical protein
MMNFTTGIACSLTLLGVAMAPIAHAGAEPPAQTFIDNGELNYVGSLSEDANRRVFALYDGAVNKPAVLSIRSKGGLTDAGIALGSWVHARKLTVKVMEYCFSSCANYVFTAAPRKVVSNFAVIGYHGGLNSSTFSLDDKMEAMLAALPAADRDKARQKIDESIRGELAKDREAETAFFGKIGVERRIATLGQGSAASFAHSEKSIGWTYSAAGFSRLGVGSIEVINPPWRPRFVNTDAQVTLIEVP